MERVTEEQAKQAHDVLRQEYWQDVFSTAEEIRDEVENGDYADWDGVQTRIDETVDGSSWVIYYADAYQCLRYSDNDEAIFEEGCYDGAPDFVGGFVTKAAYYAYRADLLEQLDRLGINADHDFDAVAGGDNGDEEGTDGDDEPGTDEAE